MKITEYVLPNAEARPRRIAITPDDIIYYSDYARGYLGRFDPKTGALTEWASPGGPKSKPYGMTFLKGAIWYSESGVRPNTLVRFDPTTYGLQAGRSHRAAASCVTCLLRPSTAAGLVMACAGQPRHPSRS